MAWRLLKTTLAGKPWRIERVRSPLRMRDEQGKLVECDGVADHLTQTISIADDVRGLDLVRVLLHECRHGQQWSASEKRVDRESRELTAVLEAAGLLARELT